jgi:LysM repeat protein
MQKNLNAQSGIFSVQFLENQLNSCKNGVNCRDNLRADSVFRSPSILLGIFILIAIFFSFAGCGRDKTKEGLDKFNERLKQLENKIDQIEAQFTETNESVNTLGSYLIALEERMEHLTKKIEKTTIQKQTVSQKGKQYHKVGRGDTLYSISRKYGLSVEKIRQFNNLSDNKPIQPGQKLLVTTDSFK